MVKEVSGNAGIETRLLNGSEMEMEMLGLTRTDHRKWKMELEMENGRC